MPSIIRSAQSCNCNWFFIGALLFSLSVQPAVAQHQEANYELAARFAPYKIQNLIYSTTVNPNWIEGTDSFWYKWDSSEGSSYFIVDASNGQKREVFDNAEIAAELTRITRDPWDAKHLPIQKIKFISDSTLRFDVTSSQDEIEDETDIEFDEENQEDEKSSGKDKPKKKVFHFEYDIASRSVRELEDWEEPDNHPSWASISPDGNTIVFGRNHNLWSISGEDYAKVLASRVGLTGDDAEEAEDSVDVAEVQLTDDGVEHYSWVGGSRTKDSEREKNKDKRKRVGISWSHDSSKFSIVRNDQREVKDLWVIHSVGNKRPELETYKYDMPGDENVTNSEVMIFDLASGTPMILDAEEFKDQSLSVQTARQFFYPDSDEPRRSLWISPDSEQFYFYRISRDLKRVDMLRADASSGEIEVLFEERLNTYVETQRLELLESGDMIWWSERDGWGHLYRYGADGVVMNQITKGAFSVRNILSVDEAQGVVYFVANAREAGEDPYYQHTYSINLDGSNLKLLNPGDFDHRTRIDPSSKYIVNNYSRVNTIPASSLHDISGRKIVDLEEADFGKLFEAGYQFPEPFTVKAGDRITDLYGVMYKPFDFDSTKSYPIVEYVYPGPQTESVAKAFSTSRYETALAQFGMIVVTVGNRGGHPTRSKWYHNYGYGNLRDYGLEDKKVTVEQLADRFDYIDAERVGIYGHSGGGFMSTAAMLVYPDFFKVAVSSAGNHTNDIYNRWWSEKHHGVEEVVSDSGEVSFKYDIDKNPSLAKNLKGRLLLTTGDVDNNVHPANTYRMVDALIKANKRFDFFLFTGQRHGYGSMSNYWFWLRAEYFVKHLLGDHRWNVNMMELNREKPQG